MYQNQLLLFFSVWIILFCNSGFSVINRGKTSKHITRIDPEKQRFERIINGEKAALEQFPFTALLYKYLSRLRNPLQCGGSIIGEVWVLTAAHCLEGRVLRIMVITGEGSKKAVAPTNVREAELSLIYDRYDRTKIVHDIGLVKVDRSFVFSQYVLPARLPSPDYDVPAYYEAYVLGWGIGELSTSQLTRNLNKLRVYILPNAECFDGVISARLFLCTINYNDGACTGDSGGPLATTSGTLLGVVSNGPAECGEIGSKVRYSNVAYYRKWIQKNTGI